MSSGIEISEALTRRRTRQVTIDGVRVGGDAPIMVQSMTNTDTADAEGTARQVRALAEAGLSNVKMLLQVHDELVFELPEGDVAAASKVIEAVMAGAAEPMVKLSVPLGVEIGTGPSWGAAH